MLFDIWRAHGRRTRGTVLAVVMTIGLLGGTALAAWAGARRTASTFAAYTRAVKLSDLAVNSPPDLARVRTIARLPGVKSSASYLGMNAYPVLNGKVMTDFRKTGGVFGSYDGRFFTQDTMTVVKGRLPHIDSTKELALSPSIAKGLGVGVGDTVKYIFVDAHFKPLQRVNFRVVGLVKLPPVIVDENDIVAGAVLPPAATRAHLESFYYVWQGIRLANGERDIPKFLDALRTDPALSSIPPITQRYDVVRVQAQRSIRPQAVALGLFGLAAAIATLALGGIGLSRLSRRWSSEQVAFRTLGMTRRQRALIFGTDSAVAVAAGIIIAMVVSIAASPLWPLGAVHEIAPDTGFSADVTVLLVGGGVLAVALLGIGAFSAWRTASDLRTRTGLMRPSAVVAGAGRSGVPLPGVLAAHFALDRGEGTRSVPVRATIFAGAAATTAVVAALVFGASLNALVTNPVRYGWAWDRMMIAEAGFGNLPPAAVASLIAKEPAVTAWSLVAFNTVTVKGETVPVLAVDRRKGNVEPPLLSGRPVRNDREIAFGKTTLDHLGLRIGDTVPVTVGDRTTELEIVGTVTLPSIGQGGGDHTSLGRGALLNYHTMAEFGAPGVNCGNSTDALCPQAILFDVAHASDGPTVVRHIAAANPDGTPGGTYEQPVSRAADIRNYDEMGALPIALAALLALAAGIAFLVTLVGTVRARRRDFAILRTLGLRAGQIRATVITQTLLTVFVTLAIGVPFGIVAGRLTWIAYAGDIGVITTPTIPVAAMIVLTAVAALICSVFALVPTALASRTPTAQVLRTE